MNVQVVDQPEIDLTVKYCIKNRICYFSVSGLDGTLIISQMTVSENYAYWVPGNTGEYLLDFVLTSKFSSVITGKFTFIVNEATDIDLVPTRYYIVNSEFELTLNPISVLNDYTTTGTGGLEISGLTLTGTVSEIDYYSVKVQETLSENYVNLVFSMICDDPPTATDLSFTMSYGEPWRYELDYQAFSTYSVTGLDCEDLNGILTLDFPESSNVYTVTIKDLRFPQYDFTINLNVQYPPRLLPIDQTQLLFYTSAEQVILIYYETAPDVSLDFDSTIFTAEVHSGYIQLTTYLEDTYYNLLSYITITNDGFSDTVFFYIFVYLKLLPIFSEISFPCEIGKNYSIDLRNCNT